MRSNNFIWFALGAFLMAIFLGSVSVVWGQSLLEDDQNNYYEQNGEYKQIIFKDTFAVNVYEFICRGYQTEVHYDNKIEYVGYGCGTQKYTYTILLDTSATTTPRE